MAKLHAAAAPARRAAAALEPPWTRLTGVDGRGARSLRLWAGAARVGALPGPGRYFGTERDADRNFAQHEGPVRADAEPALPGEPRNHTRALPDRARSAPARDRRAAVRAAVPGDRRRRGALPAADVRRRVRGVVPARPTVLAAVCDPCRGTAVGPPACAAQGAQSRRRLDRARSGPDRLRPPGAAVSVCLRARGRRRRLARGQGLEASLAARQLRRRSAQARARNRKVTQPVFSSAGRGTS